MKYRVLKTGDPCPFCGQPIYLTDPDAPAAEFPSGPVVQIIPLPGDLTIPEWEALLSIGANGENNETIDILE